MTRAGRAASAYWNRTSQIVALVALLLGLGATAFVSWQTANAVRSELAERFNGYADRVAVEVQDRVARTESGLRATAAMLTSADHVGRATFRTFVASDDIHQNLPGVLALEYARRVARDRLAGFVAQQRADEAPDFEVKTKGDAPELTVLTYVEPLAPNRAALGLDLDSEPIRREATQRAIDTGKLTLSAPVHLVQTSTPGWLLFLPLYRTAAKDLQARRNQLQGLVVAPLVIRDLLAPVRADFTGNVDFQLYDHQASGDEALFDSRDPATITGHPTARFNTDRWVTIGGRLFDVRIQSTPFLESRIEQHASGVVALAGGALTLLATALVFRLARSREDAEAKTLQGERLIRLMMENVPARLAYWDRNLRCRMINHALLRLFGQPKGEIVGRRADEIWSPEQWASLAPRVEAALRGEPQNFEWDSFNDRGEPSTVLLYWVPDTEGGQVVGLFMFSVDVSELRQAREEAQRASEAKTQFLSNMSHEIRTPMNAVLGMLGLLRMTQLNERQEDYALKAESAARSLLSLLNDILDVSKIEAGKMTLDPRPFSFVELAEDIRTILSATVGEKPIVVRFKVDPALPQWVIGDDMRLRQVLINLGGNAIKFTPRGEVTVEVRAMGHDEAHVKVQVCVRDTGIGIAPADQVRIFEDFAQTASTTRLYGGTGLGLAICRRLVALMGGELQLESGQGMGSRFFFTISLPITEVAADPQRPAPFQEQHVLSDRPLDGVRLLVAEDNLINQQVAREVLSAAGAVVDIVPDGHAAVLAVARNETYDAVLMDIQMPVMDGYQATREIRSKLMETELPIIAMTANAMDTDREQSKAAGMDAHVGKPFVPADLVRTLLHFVRREDLSASPRDDRTTPASSEAAPALPAPVAGAASAASQPVDRVRALEQLGGSEELYREVIPVFCRDARERLEQILNLPSNPCTRDTLRLFHSMKGSAATVGAYRLSELCAEAERACAIPGGELDANLLQSIADEVRRVLATFGSQAT